MTTWDILKKTRAAWPSIRNRDAEGKNDLLRGMADSLMACTPAILAENRRDMEEARGTISDVMLDRLYLDEKRLAGMAEGIRALTALPDHTGRILSQITRPNGMTICKQQVPMGLIAIIYESRPNVTSDAAALAVKSGNVCVLRSGREAYRTAKAIVQALKQGIAAAGGDAEIINIVDDTSHQSAADLMRANGLVDLLIPRGGADPPLCGERHRSLYPDRYRYLPCVCGSVRRSAKGIGHHRQRQDQSPLRVQRRGGVSGASGGGGGVPAHAEAGAGG